MRTRKSLVVIVLLMVGFIFLPCLWTNIREARAAALQTHHSSWTLVRETGMEDAADFATEYDLAGSKGDFAHKSSETMINGGPFQIVAVGANRDFPEGYSPGGLWMFAIAAGLVADDTYSFTMVGWAKTNGMAQVICEGNGIVGTQDVVIFPDGGAVNNTYWSDTIEIDTSTDWPNGINIFNSGNNQLCFFTVDLAGIEWIQFVFYDADDQQVGEADPITVYGRRY